jgi:hypothetical protein
VGAVFALEASRLARNRDWHHLVDLCALTETLLVDSDGIYDPRQHRSFGTRAQGDHERV